MFGLYLLIELLLASTSLLELPQCLQMSRHTRKIVHNRIATARKKKITLPE